MLKYKNTLILITFVFLIIVLNYFSVSTIKEKNKIIETKLKNNMLLLDIECNPFGMRYYQQKSYSDYKIYVPVIGENGLGISCTEYEKRIKK